jgi:thioredoxin 1
MAAIEVNEDQFESEVLKSDIPVVVDMWAVWCGPCRMYSPIIEEVSNDYGGKVKFVKIDVDKNEAIASKYNVMSIPTTLLIVNGTLKAMNIGAVPREILKKWIEKNLG